MGHPVADVVYRHLTAAFMLDAVADGRMSEDELAGSPFEDFNCDQPPGGAGYATMCPHCVANAYADAIDARIRAMMEGPDG